MNGLKYIRIRCNVSQSFLAQKLGVTRQAVNLWENRGFPPAKRLKHLEEFFGIDKKYFGELTEEMIRDINATPVYQHDENGHSYYCFIRHAETSKPHGIPMLLAMPGEEYPKDGAIVLTCEEDGGPLITLDEKYQTVRQELKEMIAEIEALAEIARHPMGTHEKMVSANRILAIFSPLTDAVRKVILDDGISPAHRMFYYYMLMEAMTAISVAYGSMELADLPQEEPTDPDGNPWPYGMHPAFICKMAALLKEELAARKSTVPAKARKA